MAVEHIAEYSKLEVENYHNDSVSVARSLINGREETERKTLWPRSLFKTWTAMLFLGTCLLYCSRTAMPICAATMAEEFQWSKTESGVVLGGFYWGYCFTQILGGHASDRIGGERVLLFSTICWTVITTSTPLLAQLSWKPLVSMTIARFLMGLSQGVYYPSLASLCSQRVVEGERGFLMSTMGSGSYLGTLIVGGLGSLILEHYDWETVFYSIGLLAALWAFIVWKSLLIGEILSIQVLLGQATCSCSWSFSSGHWQRLLKQPSVCAMVFAHLCFSSTSYTMMSWLPTYFKETFPHTKGWVYNVIPSLVAIPSAIFGGSFSDFLIKQGYGVAAVRKIMQFLAMGVSSVFILLLCRPVTFPSAVALTSAAMGFATFNSSGVSVNVQDLAPSCAGALFGFMNTCGAFAGLILVYFSGYMIEITHSWVTMFSVITLVNVVGMGVFLIFGDARRVDLQDMGRVTHI